MTYRVEHAPAARGELRALPRDVQRRVDAAISKLADEPRGPGAIKLAGREGYRIRAGDYRVLFTIDDAARLVLIVSIAHRREAYR